MNKKQFIKALGGAPDQDGLNLAGLWDRDAIISYYRNKYFNLYMSAYDIKGDSITWKSKYYLLKKFFYNGTIAAWKIKHTDLLGFAPYSVEKWDMYGMPDTIRLINERGVSNLLIPDKELVVGEDVVIGWYQRNHQPLNKVVTQYAEQLADVQMVINTNLQLHKMPFCIVTDDVETAKRLKDCIRRIVNSELAVYLNAADKNALASLNTATPYIIDKLYQYKIDLENELKTYMGLDNQGNFEKKERMLSEEVRSQRATIDDACDNFTDCLNEFSDEIRNVLNSAIKFEPRQKQEYNSNVEHKEDSKDDSKKI